MSRTRQIGRSFPFWVVIMVASARTWAANPASCTNDVDCTATPQCGGDVCTYTATATTCTPAGAGPKGSDGWCTVDTDCKCYAEGARCSGVFCTFTKAGDAPGQGERAEAPASQGPPVAGGAAGGAKGPSTGRGRRVAIEQRRRRLRPSPVRRRLPERSAGGAWPPGDVGPSACAQALSLLLPAEN